MHILGSIDIMGTAVIGMGLWMLWKRHVLGAAPTPRGMCNRDRRFAEAEVIDRRTAAEDTLAGRHRDLLDAERRNAVALAEEIEKLRDTGSQETRENV